MTASYDYIIVGSGIAGLYAPSSPGARLCTCPDEGEQSRVRTRGGRRGDCGADWAERFGGNGICATRLRRGRGLWTGGRG